MSRTTVANEGDKGGMDGALTFADLPSELEIILIVKDNDHDKISVKYKAMVWTLVREFGTTNINSLSSVDKKLLIDVSTDRNSSA